MYEDSVKLFFTKFANYAILKIRIENIFGVTMTNKEIIVQDINIKYKKIEQEDYISLTDIAYMCNPKEPKDVVKNWMRSRSTLEYLALWENFYNPNFKGVEIGPLLAQTGKHDFTMSLARWIEEYNAVGIISKKGKMVELMHIKILLLNLQAGFLLSLNFI